MPFEGDFTMIGTTDRDFAGDPGTVDAERGRDRLSVQGREPIISAPRSLPADVIWSFAGVRSLYDDERQPQEAAGHAARLCARARRVAGEAPLLTVYGGKITTYRRLAEEAFGKLAPVVRRAAGLDQGRAAAGRRFRRRRYRAADRAGCALSWPFLSESHARRLARAYGTRVARHPGVRQRASTISDQISAPI